MSRQVKCGSVLIGGGAPISIQSMTNTDTRDACATAAQIHALADAGCDIVRCAIPDLQAAEAIRTIKQQLQNRGVSIPIVADIHFDYRLAIAAIENGADKIRINPGNIGGIDRVSAVVTKARAAKIPIRIGVNSGSLEKDLIEEFGRTPDALAQSALRWTEKIQKMGFADIVISVKSSDVRETVTVGRALSRATDCPLHLGVTEAGVGERALIKSAVGIGALLLDGIGDTIRVSLTGDPINEVAAARSILSGVGLLPGAIDIISCPTCGRCRVDLPRITAEVAAKTAVLEKARIESGIRDILTVAIMGCAVNGPGEAAHADLGVACGDGRAVFFRKGKIEENVSETEIISLILREISQC
ncbi:MAG: flavodoxin-dependent (E)-4-hydroxy-3-methylbut-2-enyl-diphosphate synthase [Clostridiales Family XIII bacterium]|jgi:(E)-4-hydroxy-3-methylbut-2-enyl-diphosphate synthase|nr:flavodoxin-dependent (E)-4-hydroxy-3-methylbut-2-enyl-diphosphate synthase [Clostridiales Family XIII bacterium]